jgi:hypothetical protein
MVGGLLLTVSCLMPWATITTKLPNLGQTLHGTSGVGGKLALVAGVVLAVGGLSIRSAGSWVNARRVVVVAILAGLAGGGIAIWNITAKDAQLEQGFQLGTRKYEKDTHTTLTDAQIAQLRDSIGIDIRMENGIYLAATGGVLGVIAALAAIGSAPAGSRAAAGGYGFESIGEGFGGYDPMAGGYPLDGPLSRKGSVQPGGLAGSGDAYPSGSAG